jgi:3-deoxy-manno-octulosonate cytidylyltransferase (CMP-KDO synthetase)
MASKRFPGKPLALINGKPMISHVYYSCLRSNADEVWITTADEEIWKALSLWQHAIIQTPEEDATSGINCGTDRVAYAANTLDLEKDDIVVNVQGDMPFIDPSVINAVFAKEKFAAKVGGVNYRNSMTTAHAGFYTRGFINASNPSTVKALLNTMDGSAVAFSRDLIPSGPNYVHIGIYAFSYANLCRFHAMKQTRQEKKHKLEQLRALNNGWKIRTVPTERPHISIDTPEDILNLKGK